MIETRLGTIDLAVEKYLNGTFQSWLFERYQRSGKAFVPSLMHMYLAGVSTSKLSFDASSHWQSGAQKVTELHEGGIGGCLNTYVLPVECERRLRTTNALERFNQE